MNTDIATKQIQRLLGLNFNDALPLVKTAKSGAARQERVLEIEILAEKIPNLSDPELEAALNTFR